MKTTRASIDTGDAVSKSPMTSKTRIPTHGTSSRSQGTEKSKRSTSTGSRIRRITGRGISGWFLAVSMLVTRRGLTMSIIRALRCRWWSLSNVSANFVGRLFSACLATATQLNVWLRSLLDPKGAARTTVYDIVNAGSRHQFQIIGGATLHNCLGLGYGMGATRFGQVLPSDLKELLGPEDIKRTVQEFRKANWRVVDFWHSLERAVRQQAGHREVHVDLPSGRPIRYFHVRCIPTLTPWGKMKDVVHASYYKDDRRGTPLHPGLFCENYIQATARDIMADRLVAIHEKYGLIPLFSSHDEVIYEVPEEEAEFWERVVSEELTTNPEWSEGLPLEVSGYTSKFYMKD